MKSADEDQHVLNAERTVSVPLDYYDLVEILEQVPEDEMYDNLRQHLEDYKDDAR